MDHLSAAHPEHRYATLDLDHEDIPADWGRSSTPVLAGPP